MKTDCKILNHAFVILINAKLCLYSSLTHRRVLFQVAPFLGLKVVILGTQSPKWPRDRGLQTSSLLCTQLPNVYLYNIPKTGNIDWKIFRLSAQVLTRPGAVIGSHVILILITQLWPFSFIFIRVTLLKRIKLFIYWFIF